MRCQTEWCHSGTAQVKEDQGPRGHGQVFVYTVAAPLPLGSFFPVQGDYHLPKGVMTNYYSMSSNYSRTSVKDHLGIETTLL